MSRSKWKRPYINQYLLDSLNKPGDKKKKFFTDSRSSTILPQFIGLTFQIHNGKTYNKISITEEMVGHKLGEFSPTRKKFSFKKKKLK
jgi:ribosomal protein S19